MEFEVVEELTFKSRGGFENIGEMNRDKSDDLEDMNYAEKLVTHPDFIKSLATLNVHSEEKVGSEKKSKGREILVTKAQIASFRDDNTEVEIPQAATMVNKVFVALEIPFFAKAWASEKAPEVEKTKTRGDNVGEKYKVVPADTLRVFRMSDTFNIDNYFADKSAKVLSNEVRSTHQPTTGMVARENKWLDENATAYADVFKKLGLEVVPAPDAGANPAPGTVPASAQTTPSKAATV